MANVNSVSTTCQWLSDNSSIEDVELSDLYISEELERIFTWVVYGVLCQLIGIFGIVTNVINIICFIKQDFKSTVNINLLGKKIMALFSLEVLNMWLFVDYQVMNAVLSEIIWLETLNFLWYCDISYRLVVYNL